MMSIDLKSGVDRLDAEHEQVWLNLPWYVNDTLAAPEHAAAQKHLSVCLVCRREAAALRSMQRVLVARTLDPQCEAALQRLNARLDRNAAGERLFPWAAAAVLVLVTGLTGLVGLNTGLGGKTETNKAYITLGTRTTEMADTSFVTARIVFDHDVTELQMRKLLLAADAELVDGPTTRGAYTIALSAASASDDLQAALSILRESKQVLFVEPIIAVGASRRPE
jgi:hypothetical protein